MDVEETDYALALRIDRVAFARARPFYFLVGEQVLRPPRQPSRTMIHNSIVETGPTPLEETGEGVERTRAEFPDPSASVETAEASPLQLFAVRKVQTVFESMVTIGRTQNNDIVIADVQISRFHAFLKVHDDRVELGDAGSRNGTFVGVRPVLKGAPQTVAPGVRIGFAHLRFELLDAGAAWDRVRALG